MIKEIDKITEIEESLPQLEQPPTKKNCLIMSVVYQLLQDVKNKLAEEEEKRKEREAAADGRTEADPG